MPVYNVRCCCTPKKIMGTLSLPGAASRYTVPLENGSMVSVRLDHCYNPREGTRELAVHSEERPIEFWRGVVGFKEALL